MTRLLWIIPAVCVGYALLGAVVCVAVNRQRPAGMPALVYAACRAVRRHLAARALLRRAIGARPQHPTRPTIPAQRNRSHA